MSDNIMDSQHISQPDSLLNNMWEDYLAINQDAYRIHQLFLKINDGVVINDHIALRTFNLPKVNIKKIAEPFIKCGYVAKNSYHFAEKKVTATHYEHHNTLHPKIFISELLVDEFSEDVQKIINKLVKQIPEKNIMQTHFCYSGRPWKVTSSDYYALLKESEYAAWMAAFGYRPNHFTVSVNALKKLTSMEQVNNFLLKNGFQLNESGGLIKGSPEVYLEQSSTMANKINVTFDDNKTLLIPGCYYEFALRYPLPEGGLYQGFVAASADKIFESTDVETRHN